MSGYVDCACRDCFEIAISGDDGEPALCHECEEAGCDADGASECDVAREIEGTHWGYGSGSAGCLYDNQGHAETRAQAVESALFIFDVQCLPDELDNVVGWRSVEDALKEARETLIHSPSYYFPPELRGVFGADYVEVWEDDGPMPEED